MGFSAFNIGPLRWLRDYFNSHPRAESFAAWLSTPYEDIVKPLFFNCQGCGQCLLHHNGLTCCMRCPKNLRNGPCGGVRMNGHCEVYPERWCMWYLAYTRSQRLPIWREHIYGTNPPVNWQLAKTSSLVNWITGRDVGIKPKYLEKNTKPAPAKTPAPAEKKP